MTISPGPADAAAPAEEKKEGEPAEEKKDAAPEKEEKEEK